MGQTADGTKRPCPYRYTDHWVGNHQWLLLEEPRLGCQILILPSEGTSSTQQDHCVEARSDNDNLDLSRADKGLHGVHVPTGEPQSNPGTPQRPRDLGGWVGGTRTLTSFLKALFRSVDSGEPSPTRPYHQ